MARKAQNALKSWEYPKKSGIHIREILNATSGNRFGASYLVTVPARITGKLRQRKQFAERANAEEWADKTFLGHHPSLSELRRQGMKYMQGIPLTPFVCSPRLS
jgi:hypothetical protein